MSIIYSHNKDIDKDQLVTLFESVEWASAKYPEKLHQAIVNSHKVITAWDGDKLVGLINSLSDGVMTAYFHYMLVRPEYQGQGIGKKIIETMINEYKSFPAKILIAYDHAIDFYKSCGFCEEEGTKPLFISDLV